MSIFRKSNDIDFDEIPYDLYLDNPEEEENLNIHKPKYSGDYPITLEEPLDKDFVNKFRKEFEKEVFRNYPLNENRTPSEDTPSIVLKPNGSLDVLYKWHRDAMISAINSLLEKTHINHKNRYQKNYFDYLNNDTYEKMHHLFDGSIRIYKPGDTLNISAYQIPNESQMQGIKKLFEKTHAYGIVLDMHLYFDNKKHDIGKKFYDYGSFYEFINSIKHKNQQLSESVSKRIEQMRFFRNPFNTEEKEIIQRPVFPRTNLTREQVENLAKQPSLQRIPPSMRYPGANLIFKLVKIAEEDLDAEKHPHNYTGLYPVTLENPLDADYVEKFREEHDKISKKPEDLSNLYMKSIILTPDGTVHVLPDLHSYVISNIDRKLIKENPDLKQRYKSNQERLDYDYYKAIHHIFDGGIRIWGLSSSMQITAYQFPTKPQLEAIKRIFIENGYSSFEFELYFQHDNTEVKRSKKFSSIEDLENYLMVLKNQIEPNKSAAPTPEEYERIEQMRFFRNPLLEKEEKASFPPRPVFPGSDLTREQIENLSRQPSLQRTPPSMRYPGADSINNLIRIAQKYTIDKKEIEANIIIRLIEKRIKD